MDIKEKLASVPSWVWIAGSAIVLVVLFLLLKGKGSSSTVIGTGQSADFTTAMNGLSDAISNITANGTSGTTTPTPVVTPVTPTPTPTPGPIPVPKPGPISVDPKPVIPGTPSPTPTPTPTPVRYVTYVIQRGDTLIKIAQRFGTTAAKIIKLNPGIVPTNLRVGSTIKVKEA